MKTYDQVGQIQDCSKGDAATSPSAVGVGTRSEETHSQRWRGYSPLLWSRGCHWAVGSSWWEVYIWSLSSPVQGLPRSCFQATPGLAGHLSTLPLIEQPGKEEMGWEAEAWTYGAALLPAASPSLPLLCWIQRGMEEERGRAKRSRYSRQSPNQVVASS